MAQAVRLWGHNRQVRFPVPPTHDLTYSDVFLIPKPVGGSRMYLDPLRPGVEDLIDAIIAVMRSACAYAGASSLSELHEIAVVGTQSATGYSEGMPLPTSW